MHSARRRGKSRSRILYWFRTPPGVRVGRAALDEDAIRLLEQYNPDVEFDWTRILKGPPEAQPEPPAERKREASRPDTAPRRVEAQPVPAAVQVEVQTPAGTGEELQQDVPDIDPDTASEPESTLTPSAALTRLGPEALLRLRARYAEVMARIAERVTDPAQQDELKSKAERLNPDTWVTDDEVRVGLDLYEVTFEALRSVVGRPRRRRRRGRRPHGRENTDAGVSLRAEADAPQSLDANADADAVEEDGTSRGDEGDGT